jgi:catechol 2,3-dioxygenase-like lactoylglutathione lyase family enzyme
MEETFTMRMMAAILLGGLAMGAALPAQAVKRPKITGIDHVAFYTTDADGVKQLYGEVLGLASATPIEPRETLRYTVGQQWVGFSPAPDPSSIDRMDHIALATNNVVAMREYLKAKGIETSEISELSDHSRRFMVTDPDGNKIAFIQRAKSASAAPAPPATACSRRIIHAGFIVYHRDLEDHFYKDILGFRPYWHGGMKPERTDWVAIQVPNGTDWVEYMLNQPEHPTLQVAGVMYHVSLGVKNMKVAESTLEAHGWKPHGNEHTQIGRDGKWQLNIYDPDKVRVELMEFRPVEKPCCSEFTGPHPSE